VTYANKRRQPLEFEVRNHVYLRVSPMKDVKRFGVKGKLAPRYIEPFPILEVWTCGLQAWPATILSWSSRHLPRVAIEEVFEGTCGRRVARSDHSRPTCCTPSTRSRSWIRRIVSWDIKQSSSLRYIVAITLKKKQHGKARTSSFSPSRLRLAIERNCEIIHRFC
jgi:hypothetical protein